jgi:hypothetical protein
MQPLVRVIKILVSADAHMDSFASALRLLRCTLCWHLWQETSAGIACKRRVSCKRRVAVSLD